AAGRHLFRALVSPPGQPGPGSNGQTPGPGREEGVVKHNGNTMNSSGGLPTHAKTWPRGAHLSGFEVSRPRTRNARQPSYQENGQHVMIEDGPDGEGTAAAACAKRSYRWTWPGLRLRNGVNGKAAAFPCGQ